MNCSCGGVSGAFSELPFDTRDHLINYHTEGRGEDRVKYTVLSSLHVLSLGVL